MRRAALPVLILCAGAWLLSAPADIQPVVRTDRVTDDPGRSRHLGPPYRSRRAA